NREADLWATICWNRLTQLAGRALLSLWAFCALWRIPSRSPRKGGDSRLTFGRVQTCPKAFVVTGEGQGKVPRHACHALPAVRACHGCYPSLPFVRACHGNDHALPAFRACHGNDHALPAFRARHGNDHALPAVRACHGNDHAL